MNSREVFDFVKNHLLEQGVKSGVISKREDFTCLYRGPNNTKCAVGCLITDEYYYESLENRAVNNLWVREAVEKSIGNNFSYLLLGELQILHDEVNVTSWEKSLKVLEKKYFGEL